MVASSLDNLGNATRELGDHAAAKALYDEALAIGYELGDLWLVAYVLEDVAILLARLDTPVEALTLAGAAARLRRELGSPRPPASQAELDRELDQARSALGPDEASRATAAGEALDVEHAAEHAAASRSELHQIFTAIGIALRPRP
jgi:hypothetical protein